MRTDLFLEHASLHRLSRRKLVELTAKAAAAGALAGLDLDDPADGGRERQLRFTDEMFDVEAVLNGAWDDTAFYRRGDQRGTFQEVTPRKTRDALRLLD